MFDVATVLLDHPLLLVGLVLSGLYFYFTATFNFWECRGVPFKKPTVLVGNFGSSLLFRTSVPEAVEEMYQWFKDERFFGAFRVRSPVLILRDPDLVKSVCVKDFACFSNRGIPINNSQVRAIARVSTSSRSMTLMLVSITRQLVSSIFISLSISFFSFKIVVTLTHHISNGASIIMFQGRQL